MKTKIKILASETGILVEDLEFQNEVQCIRPSEALSAMERYATQQLEAERERHEKEMVEFVKWSDANYFSWETYGEALTKFRQSK